MSLLQEIQAWSKSLAPWQSDALARLLAKQELDATDQADLLALLKSAHGIEDSHKREPSPLKDEQIPVPVKAETLVLLHAIRDLKHVNAIAEGQSLPISGSGLTVIYGDNGSGKSGYSRVLKRACRARDQSEPIHPNANLPADKTAAPEAWFDISVDGAAQSVQWVQGQAAPALLSSLAIFDTRCARAYLDTEDDFSYIPYGLDVFEGLAKLYRQFKTTIDTEIAQATVDLALFAPLQGETPVGQLIATLSAKTTVEQIDALATITQEELAQHEAWGKSLLEANPKEKATQHRLLAKRVEAIANSVADKTKLVNDEVAAGLRKKTELYQTAKSAAEIAAKQFVEQETLLPGTGGEVWQELFEAARRYAVESHPGQVFPHLNAEAPCPLCQQPLGEGAERLRRFEQFILAEAKTLAQARRRDLFADFRALEQHDLALGADEITLGEMEVQAAGLAAEVTTFEAVLKSRQAALKQAVIDNAWDEIGEIPPSPVDRLQVLVQALNRSAQALEQASDEKARAALQKQFSDLDARVRLQAVRDAVVAAVNQLVLQAKLKACLGDLKTTGISTKAGELAEKVVSQELENTLNREFKALGVGTLQLSLKSRADKGKALHRLKLETTQNRSPGDILSEGEQRAIAIAAFLSEVELSGSRGAVIFDDPVSSLDHRRRERVVQRLVAEAAKRQVIILTHDIYFLSLLIDEAEKRNIPMQAQSLSRRPEGFGVAEADLPFEGKNTSRRIGALRAHQQQIAKLYREGNEPEHRKQTVEAYFHLRMAWERAVEEVLLRKVILRFRKGVETQRLVEVVVEDDDYREVFAGMSQCSNYAHDKALAGGVAVPDPEELLADIERLESWRSRVEERAVATQKLRKAR